MFKHYLEITKPGIVVGNSILIIGSFLFAASHNFFCFSLFLYTILGGSLIIASACIFNNFIDCDIDRKMKRTSHRVLSKQTVSSRFALNFAICLGSAGVLILGLLVNYLSMIFAIFGFLVYVILYTMCYKRTSIYSTFIGSFSGSTPSMIGYTAVTNTIDTCAILLFFTFIFWQMAHFYAISIIRIKDYENANIPVFALKNGVLITKQHIFYYILGFIFCNILFTILGYTSLIFLLCAIFINSYWLSLSLSSLKKHNDEKNTLQLFYYSIFVVFIFNILISIDFLF